MKALPHVGQRLGETVCCAGIALDGRWARQFPIHFRRLTDKFKRWDWIEYEWIPPRDDLRPESQRVQEETISVVAKMPPNERARFLAPFILPSTEAAAALGQTLTLIRPIDVEFFWAKKSPSEIDEERRYYEAAANQGSFFDEALKALEPCPYQFRFRYKTEDGKEHVSTCDDWESAATFFKVAKRSDEDTALKFLAKAYGDRYLKKGFVFAMGTHSRRPEQWLLVGVIRLDEVKQTELF